MKYIQLDLFGDCAHLHYRTHSYLSGYSVNICLDCGQESKNVCRNAISKTSHSYI